MRQFIDYSFSYGHTSSDTCIFWCSDPRLRGEVLSSFVSLNGFGQYDLICTPGGATFLTEDFQKAALWMHKTLHGLHHFKTVVLTVHQDCGACGGSKAFGDDWEKEHEALLAKLDRATEVIWTNHPCIKIIRAIVSFKGFEMLD